MSLIRTTYVISENVSSSSNKVIIFDPAFCKKLEKKFALVFNTTVNEYNLTQEQTRDTWTKANAKVQNTLQAYLQLEVYFGIRNVTYDISGFPLLIKDNLIIITAEFFRVSGDELIAHIEYIKNKRAQAQELKENYNGIDNIMGFTN